MTGAEALQKIIDTVDGLKNTVDELKISIQLIEANIKVLNNRAAGLMKEAAPQTPASYPARMTSAISAAGVPAQKPQQSIQAGPPSRGRQLLETPEEVRQEIRNPINETESSSVKIYKKVFGRLIDNSSEPIESVLIKVYDKNNDVCATAETDPIGYWETMLPPGRYIAEYLKTGFKTTNKTFDVGKNAKDVEVK